ncbi:MAG: DUF2169 domain-containing protein [Planctomycetota bacterium]
MDLINETGLKAAWMPGKIRPPSWSVTLVVKGTFELRPGEPARLADVQLMPTGDEYVDEDLEGVLRYPNDFGLFKPGADVLLVGHCHAPRGRPTNVCRATFQVGRFAKSLGVIGDRVRRRELWRSSSSEPKPFTSMELSYRNAFGGFGCATNPLGKGCSDETGENGERYRRLPNIEDPDRLIKDWDAKHLPSGFGPIPMTWPQRMSKTGTYNKKWQKERWPFYPEDFDWSFFNSAPEDQQLRGYLRGDEELFFENLHAEHAQYRSKLPGLRVRCFTVELEKTTELFREVEMVLDTLFVDMDQEKLVLVWHGNRDVRDQKLSFLYQLFVVTERLQREPSSIEYYRGELWEALQRRREKLQAFAAQPPAPPPPPPAAPQGEVVERNEPEPPDAARFAEEAAKAEAEVFAALEQKGHSLAGPPPSPPTPKDMLDSIKAAIDFATQKLGAAGRPIPHELTELAAAMPELIATPESMEAEADAALAEEEAEATEPEAPAEAEGTPLTRDLVLARIARREPLDQLDLTEMDLAGLDLSGLSMAGTILTRAQLKGANLSGANLSASSLSAVDLTDANLKGATLKDADLAEARLERADFSQAVLQGADLSKANLCGARLIEAAAQAALFTSADLSRADLTGANLTEANAADARLHGTNLSRATLEGCCLQGCWGRGVIADQANVKRLKAAGARLPQARFRQAHGEQSVWDSAQLYRVDFTEARLHRAEFSAAYLEGARFQNANVRMSRFVEAILRRADMTRANLFRSNLEKANLSETNLTDANCYESEFLDVVIDRTDFTGTNLKMTKLSGGVR